MLMVCHNVYVLLPHFLPSHIKRIPFAREWQTSVFSERWEYRDARYWDKISTARPREEESQKSLARIPWDLCLRSVKDLETQGGRERERERWSLERDRKRARGRKSSDNVNIISSFDSRQWSLSYIHIGIGVLKKWAINWKKIRSACGTGIGCQSGGFWLIWRDKVCHCFVSSSVFQFQIGFL